MICNFLKKRYTFNFATSQALAMIALTVMSPATILALKSPLQYIDCRNPVLAAAVKPIGPYMLSAQP